MAFPVSVQSVTELAPRDQFMPTFLFARDGPGKVTLEATLQLRRSPDSLAQPRDHPSCHPVLPPSALRRLGTEPTAPPPLGSQILSPPLSGRVPAGPLPGTRFSREGIQAEFQ